MEIRKAEISDYERILEIYSIAREYMIHSGNPNQWGHLHPNSELVRKDIEHQVCYVIYDNNIVHGVFALFDGEEPTYQYIENGEWLNNEPYVTIHRIAGDGIVHGIFKCASDYCKSLFGNIRIDTHEDNKTMQRVIEKNGFKKCGIIYVRDNSPRIAYQWTLE